MDQLNNVYKEALDQNLENEGKWLLHKDEIRSTKNCMNEFLKSAHLDIMVPIGRKAFVRGKLQHTNDILVSHSSNYFSLVSNSQANELLDARTVTCDKQVKALGKERKLFSDKLDLPNEFEAFSGEEIIEEYNEQTELEWKMKHKESVKKQKLKEADERNGKSELDSDVDQLFDRYELLEEMAGELENMNDGEISDEMLMKLMAGDTKSESKKRTSHGAEESLDVKSTYILQKYEKNPDNVTVQPPKEDAPPEGTKKKKERRRVTFSSTEDVKVIVPAQEVQVEQAPTIQMQFHHSAGKFHPDPPKENSSADDAKFSHPGEFAKFVSSIKTTETKSILKSKGSKPKKSAKFKMPEDEEQKDEFESFLRHQTVIGDVIEHKNQDAMTKPLAEVQEKPQKVSKFKEMRKKVK